MHPTWTKNMTTTLVQERKHNCVSASHIAAAHRMNTSLYIHCNPFLLQKTLIVCSPIRPILAFSGTINMNWHINELSLPGLPLSPLLLFPSHSCHIFITIFFLLFLCHCSLCVSVLQSHKSPPTKFVSILSMILNHLRYDLGRKWSVWSFYTMFFNLSRERNIRRHQQI